MDFPTATVELEGEMIVVVVGCEEVAFTSWEEKDGDENIMNNTGRMKNIFLFMTYYSLSIILVWVFHFWKRLILLLIGL